MGGRHHVFGAFEIGALGVAAVEDEIGDDGFDGGVDSAFAGGGDRFHGGFAGGVHDVDFGSGHLGESHEMVAAFGFDGDGAGRFVPLGTDLSFRDESGLGLGHEVGVFAVGGDDDAQFFGEGEGGVEFGVIDSERSFVGKKDFERGDAVVGNDGAELGFGEIVVAGDAHMEGVVAGRESFGLWSSKVGRRLERFLFAGGAAHFDESGGASNEGGLAGGFVIVFGKGSHEGKVDVDVGVDETREDKLPGGVDDFIGFHVEVLADGGDLLVFAIDVGFVALGGGDDFAVFDEKGQGGVIC